MEGFKSNKNTPRIEQDRIAKARFDNLSDSTKKIALSHGVNPETLASSSLKPEEVAAVEDFSEASPKGNRATSRKRAYGGGMTHAAIVAQKMEEKED